MSDTALRVITALVGIPAVVGMLYLGGWPFTILVLVVALLAQYEVYALQEAAGLRPHRILGMGLGALFVLRAVEPDLLFAALALVTAAIALYPFERRSLGGEPLGARPLGVGTLPATVFGAVYPAALFGILIDLRSARGPAVGDVDAFFLTLAVFVLVWSADTFAYYVGRALGKRPLAPEVSPKKTWAGAVGGVVGAVAAAAMLRTLALPEVLSWIDTAALGLIAGVIGPLGDLAESKMKRQAGVKDSGTLLPGHGGLLDRFDAMILVAPGIYLYLRFVASLLQ